MLTDVKEIFRGTQRFVKSVSDNDGNVFDVLHVFSVAIGRVAQPLHTFFASCTEENWPYVNIRGRSEKSCCLYHG